MKDTADGKRSLAASGHAILLERPANALFVESVQIMAGRYGTPEPPPDQFHLYLLNEQAQVLADLEYPYANIERTDMKWYALPTPPVEVPQRFYVALAFNPHQTKGIYLGFINNAPQPRSFTGLPDSGFEKTKDPIEWMIRVSMTTQPSDPAKARRLADWKPVEKTDPFAGATELRFDTGESEGKQSYGGRGPALRFRLSESSPGLTAQSTTMKGIRIYGSRYGSGYDPQKTMIKVALVDEQGKAVWQEEFPYSLFSYREKWVDLAASKPIPLGSLMKSALTLAVDPEAHQTKGIYFHYNKNPKSPHSLAGSVAAGFKETPDREWMLRIYLEPGK